MNEIVFLLCQKPSTALKYLLIYNVFTRAAEGTEAGDGGGGGLMWATRSAPLVILCLLRAWVVN